MSQKKKKRKSGKGQSLKLQPINDIDSFQVLENDYWTGWNTPLEERREALNKIGVKLISTSNPTEDKENMYLCDWYVFKKTLKLSWFDGYRSNYLSSSCLSSQALYGKTESFLTKRGFTRVSNPKTGDVVVYSTRNQSDIALLGKKRNTLTMHFGIYRGDQMVESKWGTGAVYLHPMNYVLDNYGSEVNFYRAS